MRVTVAGSGLGDVDADEDFAPVIACFQHVDGCADVVEWHAQVVEYARAVGPERHRRAAVAQFRGLLEHGDLMAVRDERPRRGESADARTADQHFHGRLPFRH